MVLNPEVAEYYRHGGERDRLATGTGRLEFLRTWDVLTRTLPSPPAGVLDVGGATGAYAGPLAAAGYRVHVIDPLPEHVAEAGALRGVTATVGDARALPVADAAADAVLLFGPLYHLLGRADRVDAWREAHRAVRPGGVVVAATISRFASLFAGFMLGHVADPRFRSLVEGALDAGQHRNRGLRREWFTSAYFHRPDEPAGEAAEAGLAVQRVVAVETPLWLTGGRLDEILADPGLTAALLELTRRVEDEPSILGATSHLLTIATRE